MISLDASPSPMPLWLPLGFQEWLPLAQAAVLGLMTFVQEDVPTVSAALLAAAGQLSWETGFLGVFLGIWIGDALLYLLARGAGRPLLQHAWARRFLNPVAVSRSERWFAERGTWLLLASRFVPGTRLPTYLAAGFLRLPFPRFLAVTATAVALWTIGIFLLAYFVGPGLVTWLKRWKSGGWTLLLTVVVMLVVLRLLTKAGKKRLERFTRKRFRPSFRQRWGAVLGRCTRWEFWPAWLFYLPVALNYLRLALKYRGFMVPTAANPGIFSGGFVGESKTATLSDLQATSPEFTAEAFLLPPAELRHGADANLTGRGHVLDAIRSERGMEYPFILKPDVGQRGVGVKLIRTPEQAAAYLRQTSAPLVVQRYAPGPMEAGVFYFRFPGEPRGRILAITEKVFPTLTGDGVHSVEELLWRDTRARMMAATYLRRLGDRRFAVPAPGEIVRLVEAGNHAQGCIFRDGLHLWSEALEQRIDEISRRVNGFFIGRYDIRYRSEAELKSGSGFQIIELNGAASEATSLYDARHSLLAAYRILFRQWELVFAIGDANRRRGATPSRPAVLWRKWRESTALAASYPLSD